MPDYDDDTDRHHANRNKSRLRKQRAYQAHYRDRLKQSGTPDRETIAAETLRIVVAISLRHWEERGAKWEEMLVKSLQRRGFEPGATSAAFRSMLDREWARRQAKASEESSDE